MKRKTRNFVVAMGMFLSVMMVMGCSGHKATCFYCGRETTCTTKQVWGQEVDVCNDCAKEMEALANEIYGENKKADTQKYQTGVEVKTEDETETVPETEPIPVLDFEDEDVVDKIFNTTVKRASSSSLVGMYTEKLDTQCVMDYEIEYFQLDKQSGAYAKCRMVYEKGGARTETTYVIDLKQESKGVWSLTDSIRIKEDSTTGVVVSGTWTGFMSITDWTMGICDAATAERYIVMQVEENENHEITGTITANDEEHGFHYESTLSGNFDPEKNILYIQGDTYPEGGKASDVRFSFEYRFDEDTFFELNKKATLYRNNQ